MHSRLWAGLDVVNPVESGSKIEFLDFVDFKDLPPAILITIGQLGLDVPGEEGSAFVATKDGVLEGADRDRNEGANVRLRL